MKEAGEKGGMREKGRFMWIFHMGDRVQSHWAIFFCLPRYMSSKLAEKQSSWKPH